MDWIAFLVFGTGWGFRIAFDSLSTDVEAQVVATISGSSAKYWSHVDFVGNAILVRHMRRVDALLIVLLSVKIFKFMTDNEDMMRTGEYFKTSIALVSNSLFLFFIVSVAYLFFGYVQFAYGSVRFRDVESTYRAMSILQRPYWDKGCVKHSSVFVFHSIITRLCAYFCSIFIICRQVPHVLLPHIRFVLCDLHVWKHLRRSSYDQRDAELRSAASRGAGQDDRGGTIEVKRINEKLKLKLSNRKDTVVEPRGAPLQQQRSSPALAMTSTRRTNSGASVRKELARQQPPIRQIQQRRTSFSSLVRSRSNGSNVQLRRRLWRSHAFVRGLELNRRLKGHTGCVNTIAWNARGTLLVSGSDDTTVKVWPFNRNHDDDEPGRTSGSAVQTYESGHVRNVFSAEFVPTSNDTAIVTTALDGMIRLLELDDAGGCTSRLLGRCSEMVLGVAFPSVIPCAVFTAQQDGLCRSYDMRASNANPSATVVDLKLQRGLTRCDLQRAGSSHPIYAHFPTPSLLHTTASTSTRNFPTNSRSRAKTRLSDSTTFELRQEVRSCATGKPVRVARHTPDATKAESRPYDSLGGRRGLACLRTIATLPWRSLTHLSARRSALRSYFLNRVITRLHRRSV